MAGPEKSPFFRLEVYARPSQNQGEYGDFVIKQGINHYIL
jgi:hypothetical protein